MTHSTHYDCHFDGLYQDRLYGWAIDLTELQRRLVIELTVADEVIACDIANHYREVPEHLATSDKCHGFSIDISALKKYGYRFINLQIANTTIRIASQIDIQAEDYAKQAPSIAQHLVFHDGGLRLIGWYQRQGQAATQNRVHAYLGDELLCSAIANELLPAVRHFHEQASGFQLNLPYRLADGLIHSIRVVDDQGMSLNGSPLSICLAPNLHQLARQSGSASLSNIVSQYDALFPKSVHMSYYDDWFSEFGQYPCRPNTAVSINILIYGDLAQAAISQDSINRQANANCHVVLHDGYQLTDWPALYSHFKADSPLLLLRSGDTLHPHAAANLVDALQEGALLVYADSDIPQPYPQFHSARYPWLKQDWDYWYALATDYQLEPMLISADLLTGMNAAACNSLAQMQWQACMMAMNKSESSIKHLPQVLYHQQQPFTEYEQTTRLAAALHVCQQNNPDCLLQTLPNAHPKQHSWPRHLQHSPVKLGKVSLIIPTRDQLGLLKRCIDSIRTFTALDDVEIIIVNNNSDKEETMAYFAKVQKEGIRVLNYPGIFNFSRINNFAVGQASGDIIGFINNDIEALHQGWLSNMLAWLSQPEVAAVGAKLLWPNEMVQHGGIVMGVGMAASHYGMDRHKDDSGYFYRNQLSHQVSGVTAACLLMRKSEFENMGGFDETQFPVAFNDVDLCLRLRKAERKIIWCADSIMLHAESASRGKEDSPAKQQRARYELRNLREKWQKTLTKDPFYHEALNLEPQTACFNGLRL